MLDRLTYRSGCITGLVAGRMVNCVIRPTEPGVMPPPGEYRVSPPTSDVVFGPVAFMMPANSGLPPGGGIASMTKQERPGASGIASMTKQERPGASGIASMTKQELPGTSGIASMTKQELPGGIVETKYVWDSLAPGSSEFVLATRPIAGRNCLIVTGGSQFFDGIAAAGGAVITVL